MRWSAKKLIVIAALLVAAGVLVFFATGQRVAAPDSGDQGTNASSTAGEWKTYRNEEYGVEFKYPEDAAVSENGTYVFNPRGLGMAFRIEKRSNPSIAIELIPSVENPSNDSIEDWIRRETRGLYDRIEKSPFDIGETVAFVATSEKSPGAFGYRSYFFVINGKIRFVSFAMTSGYSEMLEGDFLKGVKFLGN